MSFVIVLQHALDAEALMFASKAKQRNLLLLVNFTLGLLPGGSLGNGQRRGRGLLSPALLQLLEHGEHDFFYDPIDSNFGALIEKSVLFAQLADVMHIGFAF